MKAYIHLENGIQVVSLRTHPPLDLVAECPKYEDGSYCLDLDRITMVGTAAIIDEDKVVAKDAALAVEKLAKDWVALRMKRNFLLLDSDGMWVERMSKGQEMAAVNNYKQALRDLPANTTDPLNPTWPTKP